MNKFIVVDTPKNWEFLDGNIPVISSQDYIANPEYSKVKNVRIFNLCRNYSYQSKGYYVSLLAEARGHLAIPTTKNLVDLKSPKIVKIISEEFDELIQQNLKNIKSREFDLSVYFGQNVASKYKELSAMFFRHFQIPFIKVKFVYKHSWKIQSIKSISILDISEEHKPLAYQFARDFFSKKRYDTVRPSKAIYDLAILVQPNDPAPPSNPKALKKFVEIAEKNNFYVEIIGPKELSRLSSFDALLIRQSTEVNNEAYAFARKAQQENIAIVDYPDAILKCCNKVFMAEALENANIPAPKTRIVNHDNAKEILEDLKLPCILKAPDSTFSFGVKKAKTEEEYYTLVKSMLQESELIIAQEFCPSDFDWRIGILDGQPFYACKYYMAKGHWQIYNWNAKNKDDQDGNADVMAIEDVPKKIMETALNAGKIMGPGLLGIDIKEVNGKPLVIEINDNPNIDFGVEDRYYGDLVYSKIIEALLKRLEDK
ncbi:MAG: RimK family alpha-L-glutamate ligase [Flavobacteriaceae bacterium]|nr:RimK family alpha-L-glutamate ligase [Flavobacteriaceae bacterium]|tara:strand:- start:202533 stop:203984 length:1452 start_codon:yes stop_codon:yes gene_type:complete